MIRLLPERLQSKLEVTAEECWLWLGRLTVDGYGHVHIGDTVTCAHRAVFELLKGKVDGLHLHHRDTCERRCCNPDHLTPMTPQEHAAAHRKTHCQRGHELTPENCYVPPNDGRRRCRLCIQRKGQHGKSAD